MYEQVSDLDYFKTLVADPDGIPLLEAAASLGVDAQPELDLQEVLSSVDVQAQRLANRCVDVSTELSRLQATVDFFYKELRFAGNINDYYSPDNSYLHKVIETRRGIPISLAVLFVELARHVGLDAHGVSFPGHFLVTVNLHEGAVVLDPFTGKSLSGDELHERFEPLRAHLATGGQGLVPLEQFLRVASPAEILLRMLNNLHHIFAQLGEHERLSRIDERIEVLKAALQDPA
ncbi:MAG: SirB1 family protein [Burkholderiaceae bacterium]